MKIVSINIAKIVEVDWQGQKISTGIFKKPVRGPVRIHKGGVEGDRVADLNVHGGEHKAVYTYGAEEYDWWREHLKQPDLAFGALGENLSLSQFNERQVYVGDKFKMGREVILEAIQPRHPCFKLGIRFGNQAIIKTFLDHAVFGVYFRVVQEGMVGLEDEVAKIDEQRHKISIPEVFGLMKGFDNNPDKLAKLASIPNICPKMKRKLVERLALG